MPDRVIELLEQAKAYAICGSRSTIVSCIEEAMTELKIPRWETPNQYKEWPDDWAVYSLYESDDDGHRWWYCESYHYALFAKSPSSRLVTIICATEAGPPPDDWRPKK
jgi:hypothetical protein